MRCFQIVSIGLLSLVAACGDASPLDVVSTSTVQQAETTGPLPICTGAGCCGNLILNLGEGCDDGDTTSGDGCSSTCALEPGWTCLGIVCDPCGNGVARAGEQCDDGNAVAGDGCSATCTIESGWACSGAPSACHAIVCGDGIVDPPEGCDDGPDTSDFLPDRCRSDCQPARCGDGVEDAAEICDWGQDNGTSNGCLANCAGYADYQFSNGADIALTPIPGVVAVLASVTDAELQCIHADPIQFEAFQARADMVHSFDMVVGAVAVLTVDTLVDDPVILYDNGEHLDGRTLVHQRAPFVDVAPGRYFLPAGATVAMGLHGGSLASAPCPCSTGGSQSIIGCEILPPGRGSISVDLMFAEL